MQSTLRSFCKRPSLSSMLTLLSAMLVLSTHHQECAAQYWLSWLPLLDIAEAQRVNNVRDHTPNFLPCVLSHEGDFSGGAIQAIEHFTLAFKQTCEDAALMGERKTAIPSNKVPRTFALLWKMLSSACRRSFLANSLPLLRGTLRSPWQVLTNSSPFSAPVSVWSSLLPPPYLRWSPLQGLLSSSSPWLLLLTWRLWLLQVNTAFCFCYAYLVSCLYYTHLHVFSILCFLYLLARALFN